MESKHNELTESNIPILQQIIAQYSALWADVMYNRRLPIHLRKLERDIQYIHQLRTAAPEKNKSCRSLIAVQHDLIRLREIIKRKIPTGFSLKNVAAAGLLIDLINT